MKNCHHFIRGELYKCGVVAVLPEFDQQNSLTLDEEDRQLMHNYHPLNISQSFESKKQFVSDLQNLLLLPNQNFSFRSTKWRTRFAQP